MAIGTFDAAEPQAASTPLDDTRLTRGAIAWALFEGGRNPYIVLVVIYIFMPYVASVMVGDAVRGQHLIASWNQYFGWIVMFTAPILGASIDKLGPRKGLLGLIVTLMVPMIAALWWARPDGSGLSIGTTMFLGLAVLVLFSYSEVLHNSLLVRAAGLARAHRASGLALMLGNLFSVVALAFSAWAFALPGKVDWAWVPAAPLFGLDPALHEPERVVALLAAALLVIGVLPLMLFTPDAPRTGIPLGRVLREAVGEIVATLSAVRRHRQAVTFLGARMFFVDGMSAFLIYSGVYAIGVMQWDALEMFAYGILLSLSGAIGGVVAPWLDQRFGPKRALQAEVSLVALGVLLLLGMAQDTILYVWRDAGLATEAIWGGPVFQTLPDCLFISVGCVTSTFVLGHFASSRTMLTRITPPEQTGVFFGVYALSGVATGWLAPLLVSVGTSLTHNQKGGFAAILLLLGIGLAGLALVKEERVSAS
jgi:MFS transporter, UMF1 family